MPFFDHRITYFHCFHSHIDSYDTSHCDYVSCLPYNVVERIPHVTPARPSSPLLPTNEPKLCYFISTAILSRILLLREVWLCNCPPKSHTAEIYLAILGFYYDFTLNTIYNELHSSFSYCHDILVLELSSRK